MGTAAPFGQLLALRMLRFGHGVDQIVMTGNAAAIYQRACAGARFVGDCMGPVTGDHFLYRHLMLPAASELPRKLTYRLGA